MSAATLTRPGQVFDGYAFDLDGTVYLGDHALPGAVECIGRLREGGTPVVFVTNKPLEMAAEYAAKLTRLGIPASENDVVTAVDSLLHYLTTHHRGATVLTVAEPAVDDALRQAGFRSTTEPPGATSSSSPSTAPSITPSSTPLIGRCVCTAPRWSRPIPIAYCPTPDGGLPDCAAMLAAVEACTGARAEAVTGKPSHSWPTRYCAD